LFTAAQSAQVAPAVKTDLDNVIQLMSESQDFRTLWQHPAIQLNDKKTALNTLLNGRLQPLTLNLLMLLLDKKRTEIVVELVQSYSDLLDAFNKVKKVTLKVAHPLLPNETAQLQAALEKQLNKRVEIDMHIDPSLVGGLVLKVDDNIVDNSIMGRFQAVKNSLS
jgi:F-type H+-transporting ATPase subunit delta